LTAMAAVLEEPLFQPTPGRTPPPVFDLPDSGPSPADAPAVEDRRAKTPTVDVDAADKQMKFEMVVSEQAGGKSQVEWQPATDGDRQAMVEMLRELTIDQDVDEGLEGIPGEVAVPALSTSPGGTQATRNSARTRLVGWGSNISEDSSDDGDEPESPDTKVVERSAFRVDTCPVASLTQYRGAARDPRLPPTEEGSVAGLFSGAFGALAGMIPGNCQVLPPDSTELHIDRKAKSFVAHYEEDKRGPFWDLDFGDDEVTANEDSVVPPATGVWAWI